MLPRARSALAPLRRAVARASRVHHTHFPGCGCGSGAGGEELFGQQLRAFSSSAAKAPAVGFIGLGNMGGHMAHNLLRAGHPLVVYDLNQSALDKLTQQAKALGVEARVAKTPRDLGAQVSTLVTMLPSSPHVRDVYLNKDSGILAGLRSSGTRGALLIDSSTIDPQSARDVALAAAEEEAGAHDMVDAPVSGGVGGAEAGTLTFMVGGSDNAFARAQPFLARMGKNIVHCGGVGTGQVAKVCNNVILGMSMAAVAEGMALGVKLGMDPKVLAGILNTSSARCWSSEIYNPCPGVVATAPASRGYTGGFGVQLMLKDMGLATSAGRAAGQALPMAQLAEQLYADIVKQGGSGKDFSFIYEHLLKMQAEGK